MNTTLFRFLTAVAVTGCAGAAHAQAASAPRTVGENASTAVRAQAMAASSSDVGTLVKTGPSATHEARRAARHAEVSASSASHHRAHHVKMSDRAASDAH